jgi:hypothetical protein
VQAKQGRLELDLPLDTRSETYDDEAAPAVRVKQLALRGTPVALRQREHGTLAVATFSGGALHLSPITWPEKTGAFLLLAATLLIGLKPDLLLNWIVPSLQSPLMKVIFHGGAR